MIHRYLFALLGRFSLNLSLPLLHTHTHTFAGSVTPLLDGFSLTSGPYPLAEPPGGPAGPFAAAAAGHVGLDRQDSPATLMGQDSPRSSFGLSRLRLQVPPLPLSFSLGATPHPHKSILCL